MTIFEFRQNPIYTARMREMLGDEIVQTAILCLKDYNAPREVEVDDADPVASVRRHSRGTGWNNALIALLAMGESTPLPPPPEESTYDAP